MKRTFFLGCLLALGGCASPHGMGPAPVPFGYESPPEISEETRTSANQSRTLPDGRHYQGPLRNDQPHGSGLLSWPDGAQYKGVFQEGKRTGQGIFTWPSGNRYKGGFLDGKRHGQGTFTWANGARYTGTYRFGSKHGTGLFTDTGKTVEVCSLVPARETQVWNAGRMTAKGEPPPDEPTPDLARETKAPPGSLIQKQRLTRRLARRTARRSASRSAQQSTSRPARQSASRSAQQSTSRPARQSASRPAQQSVSRPAQQSAPRPAQQSAPQPAQQSVRITPKPPIQEQELRPTPKSMNQARFWLEKKSGMRFIRVPGGCFDMGTDQGNANESPRHEVCLTPFWIGEYEVTQAQWRQVLGTLPPQARMGEKLPIENVSWNDVQRFVRTLNSATSGHFQLPTEAQWEYACRSGGKAQPFCGGSEASRFAWNKKNSTGGVHPVGGRQPNGLGLYDMSGNVWEWVADWYDENYYTRTEKSNPTGPKTGTSKVFRGGAWLSAQPFLRASLRYDLAPQRGYHLLGFRLAFKDRPNGRAGLRPRQTVGRGYVPTKR